MAKAKQQEPSPQTSLLSIKGDPEWLEWLKRYADFLGVQATTAIDMALREGAIKHGFKEQMPKRLPGRLTR